MSRPELIHGTCIVVDETGVLLRGPSGAGKSDLALRLIEAGGVLVADDQIELTPEPEGLVAAPPERLAGILEVRGVGIVPMAYCSRTFIGLVVDLVAPAEIPRLSERSFVPVAGRELPRILIAPFEVSAVAKLRVAARTIAIDTPLFGPGTTIPARKRGEVR